MSFNEVLSQSHVPYGDVATWVSSIATAGALFWAVFLYRKSIDERSRDQARFFTPLGDAFPQDISRGQSVPSRSSFFPGLKLEKYHGSLLLAEDATRVTVKLVSTSKEAFTNLRIYLVVANSEELEFPNSLSEIAPDQNITISGYFPRLKVSGPIRVKVCFEDSDGVKWQRTNGAPLRKIGGARRAFSERSLGMCWCGDCQSLRRR